uniref:Uncharacterized protein n=1 Tax=Arundo donax TaxID=35708 RepID=A0A0A9GWP4_ARUDO
MLVDVTNHLGTSKSKLHRMKRASEIQRVSNTMEPLLTDKHKEDRLKWCLRMLDPRSLP